MKPIIERLVDKIPYVAELRRQIEEEGAFPAGHYYSPVPSKVEVAAGVQRKDGPIQLSDVDLRPQAQLELLEKLSNFYEDLPFSEEESDECRYYFGQGWFCYTDAIMLYSLIRHFEIRRIIEVGSGYSSAVMLDTLEGFCAKDFKLTFIEPFPDRLKSLVDVESNPSASLLENRIQDVELEVFDALSDGDLLFVDSSHVVKYGSDLNFLLFRVLPRLKKGVHVHFHDIFYPFEYPAEWLSEGRYWNECYLLRAFLSGNKDWEVTLFNDYVNLEFGDFIEKNMPLCRENFGGSLYLRKLG